MKRIKVSVIVPVYNAEIYIERCILSIKNQLYENIEIILVNDGSKDNSLNICKRLAKNDDRFIIIDKENTGVCNTRNVGIKKATGDYIVFVDSDDYIEQNCISDCVNILKSSNDIDIIKYSFVREGKNGKSNYKFSTKTDLLYKKNEYKEKIYPLLCENKDYESIWNIFIKSEIAKKVLFDECINVTEDFLFMVKCILESKSIFFVNKCYYHYYVSNCSVTQIQSIEKNFQKINDIFYSYSNVDDELKKYGYYDFNELSKNKVRRLVDSKISIIAQNTNYKKYRRIIKNISSLNYSNNYVNYKKYSFIIIYINFRLRYFIKTKLKKIMYG